MMSGETPPNPRREGVTGDSFEPKRIQVGEVEVSTEELKYIAKIINENYKYKKDNKHFFVYYSLDSDERRDLYSSIKGFLNGASCMFNYDNVYSQRSKFLILLSKWGEISQKEHDYKDHLATALKKILDIENYNDRRREKS